MFVRTKKGKILKCFKSESMNLPIYYVIGSKTNGYVEYQDVKKVSEDIIDILELGDYVNGCYVVEVTRFYTGNGNYIRGVDTDTTQLYGWDTGIPENKIKSIVTKEQFESMQYVID